MMCSHTFHLYSFLTSYCNNLFLCHPLAASLHPFLAFFIILLKPDKYHPLEAYSNVILLQPSSMSLRVVLFDTHTSNTLIQSTMAVVAIYKATDKKIEFASGKSRITTLF